MTQISELTDTLSREGFSTYRASRVRRLSYVHYLVKTESGVGSFLVDLKEREWVCDCGKAKKLRACVCCKVGTGRSEIYRRST